MRRKSLIVTLLMAVCVTLAIPRATYAQSPQPLSPAFNAVMVDTICGDVNYDGAINIADAVFIMNSIFTCGPLPQPVCIGDVNSDGGCNIGDTVYLLNYIFRSGPPPEPCCTEAVDRTTVQRMVKCSE